MFTLICVWINGCVNNCEAGDLRRYCAHYGVTVMSIDIFCRLECTHNDIPEDNYCHWHNIPMMNSNLPYFADNILKCNIMCGNCCALIPNSMRFLSESTINNKAIAMTPTTTCGDIKPALFQIMAWCRVGDNPLSKPIMTWFTDAYSIYISTDEKSLPTLVHHGIFMTFDDYRYIIWDIQQYFFFKSFPWSVRKGDNYLPHRFYYISTMRVSLQQWQDVIFKFIFFNKHKFSWINLQEICSLRMDWYRSALVMIMTWHRMGNKPLPEPMIAYFTGAHMHQQNKLSLVQIIYKYHLASMS